jgi:hypothetical protein
MEIFMSRKNMGKNFLHQRRLFLFLSTRFYYDFYFMGKLIFSELNFKILVYLNKH